MCSYWHRHLEADQLLDTHSITEIRIRQFLQHVARIVIVSIDQIKMSGKRLLDAIQLLNVAKNVAGKHLTIRQQQLDVYTRTSSLTKGLKQQYDNLVVTAQAASALARRFDENQPSAPWSDDRATRPANEDVIINTSQKDAEPSSQSQAHDIKTVKTETTLSSEEARKLQRQAEFQIPAKQAAPETSSASDYLITSKAQDTYYSPSLSPKVGLSSLPRVKIPQEGSVAQESDPHVTSGPINSDVFHTPKNATEEPSEEALQAVFRSPKVAGLLLSKKKRNPYINNREEQVVKPEPVKEETIKNVTEEPKVEKIEKEDVQPTMETLPKDVQVRMEQIFTRIIIQKLTTSRTSSRRHQ